MAHYSYHACIKQRIKNGELTAIREEKEPFALRFFFSDGTSKPIRFYRVPEYMEFALVREKLKDIQSSSIFPAPE